VTTAPQVIAVRAKQYYTWMSGGGWSGLQYQVKGAAIPIQMSGGELFVLLHSQPGKDVATEQGNRIREIFSVENGDTRGRWVKQWNAAASSRQVVPLGPDNIPLFLYVPAGGDPSDMRVLTFHQLPSIGLQLRKASLELTRDEPIVPAETAALHTKLLSFGFRDLPRDVLHSRTAIVSEMRD
jgi:hypothetical protein